MTQKLFLLTTDVPFLELALTTDGFATINIREKLQSKIEGFTIVVLDNCTATDCFLLGSWIATEKAKLLMTSKYAA